MAKTKGNKHPATRHQPRRATRDDRKETKKAGSAAITRKPKATTARSSAKEKLKATLLRKVDAMDPGTALLEQSTLFGVSPTTSKSLSPKSLSPKSPQARKRGRKGHKSRVPKPEKKFMDDIFGSDDEIDAADQLQRGERWIPDMELRSRTAQRPPHLPHQLWMSYCLLDEYIYRQSLTADEVLSLPLMDDVYTYQHGGPKPVTPPGFRWNSHRQLVPEDDDEEV